MKFTLEYVLDGKPLDELKERVVGAAILHKKIDYDTAQDNSVRVTANEVRKRLAQYYGDEPETSGPVFHLSPWTYAVSLHWRREEPLPIAVEPRASEPKPLVSGLGAPGSVYKLRVGWQAILVGIMALVALLALASIPHLQSLGSMDLVRNVWSPFIESPKAVAIGVSQPVPNLFLRTGMTGSAAQNDQMTARPDAVITNREALALAQVVKLLSEHRKPFQLLRGDEAPYKLLRAGPIVLIGNGSDQRILDILANLRFYFGPNHDAIYDRSNPAVRWALGQQGPDAKGGDDYAVVSRLESPMNGQPMMIVAGISDDATSAAGNFVTNNELLAEAFQKAPKGWEKMNFQFVLHTGIAGSSEARPTVVASEFW